MKRDYWTELKARDPETAFSLLKSAREISAKVRALREVDRFASARVKCANLDLLELDREIPAEEDASGK